MDIYGKYDRVLYGKVWASKQEAKMFQTLPKDRLDELLLKVAIPHAMQGFESVPPAFNDWSGDVVVDFHSEFWPDKELGQKIMSAFQHQVAVAIPRGGQYYAISFPNSYANGKGVIEPIDVADAKDMVSFPEDWEKYVKVQQIS